MIRGPLWRVRCGHSPARSTSIIVARVMRIVAAASAAPSVTAGSVRCRRCARGSSSGGT